MPETHTSTQNKKYTPARQRQTGEPRSLPVQLWTAYLRVDTKIQKEKREKKVIPPQYTPRHQLNTTRDNTYYLTPRPLTSSLKRFGT